MEETQPQDQEQAEQPQQKAVSSNGEKLTARRFPLPWSLWSEVLKIAKSSGADYRDTMICLLDLGLQTQDQGFLKPRVFSVEHPIWKKITEAAAKLGLSDEEAAVKLLDLGVQAKLLEAHEGKPATPEPAPAPPPPTPPKLGVTVVIEPVGGGGRLASLTMPSVPDPGEVIAVSGKSYVVDHRAWAVEGGKVAAFLRVQPYKAGA